MKYTILKQFYSFENFAPFNTLYVLKIIVHSVSYCKFTITMKYQHEKFILLISITHHFIIYIFSINPT